MKTMLQRSRSLGLNSLSCDNYLHRACSVLKQSAGADHLAVLETFIDFNIIFESYLKNGDMMDDFEGMYCGWYDAKHQYQEGYFLTQLNKLMTQSKVIFIYLDFHNYFLAAKEAEKSDADVHEQVFHATACVLYPTKKGSYKLHYFNSHGHIQLSFTQYNKYISRKRNRYIDLPVHLDGYVIGKMVETFNNNIGKYVANPFHIDYGLEKEYNYYGPNLQIGDDNGICFSFPFMLFYELCFNYGDSLVIDDNFGEKRRFNSVQRCLERGEFNKVVLMMMCRHSTVFKRIYIRDYGRKRARTSNKETMLTDGDMEFNERMDDVLEGVSYLPSIFCGILRCLGDPDLKKTL